MMLGITLDQLGWMIAGLFIVLFFALALATRGLGKRAQDQGWHERQHWEDDQIVKGKLERQ